MFRSAIVTCEAGSDPAGAVAFLRALAPRLRELGLIVRLPVALPHWPGEEPWGAIEASLDATFAEAARLRERLGSEGLDLRVDVEPDFTLDPLREAAGRAGAEAIVIGPFSRASAAELTSWADDLTRSAGVPVVLAPRIAPAPAQVTRLLCPFDGEVRSLAAVAAFLRDGSRAGQRVTMLSLGDEGAGPPIDLEALAAIAGISAAVVMARRSPSPIDLAEQIAAFAAEDGDDAVVVAAGRTGVLGWLSGRARRRLVERTALPVIVAPAIADALPGASLDAPDLVVSGATLAVHAAGLDVRGRPAPVPDQDLAIVSEGRLAAVAPLRAGVAHVAVDALGSGAPVSLGLGRLPPGGVGDPLAVIEAHIGLLRPGARRVTLFDARLDGPTLRAIREARGGRDPGRLALGVRLSRDDGIASLRARIAAAGIARPLVVDARAILDEGDAADVPSNADGVRLHRIAGRLRAAGVQVDTVVLDGLASAFAPPSPGGPGASRLDVTTGAPATAGNRVEITLDNRIARETLLALVRGARERVHLQVYIVDDDDVAREVATALGDAAARGVAVRMLVDSLYSQHGSYGVTNPVLAALGARPGVAVRASRPLRGLPTLEDLKQRDHRKILVVDGAVATLGGRNLGAVYYRGFSEARLSPSSAFRDVPWLDAGARIEGPAVAALDTSFLDAWTQAGGDPFPIAPAPAAGDVQLRVVVHRGLSDAYTLEAYRALIDGARARLDVANCFPLQLEVQHALLRAVARGVRVRALLGRVRPVHGADVPFAGPSPLYELANQLVHARMDVLAEAGAAVYELTLAPGEGWDPAVGAVRPHVHAKLMCADGEVTAVGSANLDVTSAYWESEALLVVEDARVTARVEADLDALFAGSTRLDPEDPSFRDRRAPRAWLSRHWPSLVG